MRKLFKNEIGITLIALVITIIVLIMLAGVSINLVIGEDGIITKAKEASVKQAHAQVISEVEMKYLEYETKLATEILEDDSFINYLDSNNYLKDNGDIDVVALIGNGATLGKGTAETDAYFVWIDENEEEYCLSYEDKEGNIEELWRTKNVSDTLSDTYFIANKQGTIIGLTDEGKKQTTLVVPTQINGVNITAINTAWGLGEGSNYVLTSLTIPNTITGLTQNSLSSCIALTNVTFQGTMEEWSKFGLTGKFPYSFKLEVIHCTDGDVTL